MATQKPNGNEGLPVGNLSCIPVGTDQIGRVFLGYAWPFGQIAKWHPARANGLCSAKGRGYQGMTVGEEKVRRATNAKATPLPIRNGQRGVVADLCL